MEMDIFNRISIDTWVSSRTYIPTSMAGKSSDVQIQIQPNLQIQIQIRSFKKLFKNPIQPFDKLSNPNPGVHILNFAEGGFMESSNPNSRIFKSKSTISKKFKSNSNPVDLAKVVKSGFKSKSGFGFAHHCPT